MVLSALIGAAGSFLGGRAQRRDNRRAEGQRQQFLQEGQQAFEGTPVVQSYMPGGANAFETRQALMGLGGDPAAARESFNNYLGSTDFGFRMRTGSDALTGSRAAKGLLGSGRTGTALTDFGQNLGSRYMDSYLDRLGADANTGLQAGMSYGNVLTGNASQLAGGAERFGARQAENTGATYGGVGEALGRAAGSKPARAMGGKLMNRFFGEGN